MKQLELDDRTFDRAERQARVLRLSMEEYVRNLVEHERTLRPSAKNPIGLFADRPEIIDEMMTDVIQSRTLPLRAHDEYVPARY